MAWHVKGGFTILGRTKPHDRLMFWCAFFTLIICFLSERSPFAAKKPRSIPRIHRVKRPSFFRNPPRRHLAIKHTEPTTGDPSSRRI